ncbi:MAG: OmpA family protein, partial [Methylomarinum sp.]|nr:OmpA family protein [Methylomarinum sp.]
GHADERGSREYNIALGEQRAKSVYRMMKVQGVADNQLEIVSYGEEKPAEEGMNEASWQLNRRVEIAYQGQ